MRTNESLPSRRLQRSCGREIFWLATGTALLPTIAGCGRPSAEEAATIPSPPKLEAFQQEVQGASLIDEGGQR